MNRAQELMNEQLQITGLKNLNSLGPRILATTTMCLEKTRPIITGQRTRPNGPPM